MQQRSEFALKFWENHAGLREESPEVLNRRKRPVFERVDKIDVLNLHLKFLIYGPSAVVIDFRSKNGHLDDRECLKRHTNRLRESPVANDHADACWAIGRRQTKLGMGSQVVHLGVSN